MPLLTRIRGPRDLDRLSLEELDRLADEPARYGWNADFALVDAKDPDVDALAADPRVEGVTVLAEGTVRVGSEFAATSTMSRQEGTVPWTTSLST